MALNLSAFSKNQTSSTGKLNLSAFGKSSPKKENALLSFPLPPVDTKVANSTPSSTPIQALRQGSKGLVLDALKATVQAPFKFTGSLLASGEQVVTGKPTSFDPKTQGFPALQGDEPVPSLQIAIPKATRDAESAGVPKSAAPLVAVGAVVGGGILDLAPFGGSRKSLAKMLAEADNFNDAATILRNAGVPEDLTPGYAAQFVPMRDLKQIDAGLNSLEQVLRSTRNIQNGDSVTNMLTRDVPQRGTPEWPTSVSKPSTAESISTGSARTGKEGVSVPKADTSVPFDGVSRLYTPQSKEVDAIFRQSVEQTKVGPFEIGSFGKNAALRKAENIDRFPEQELPETIPNITAAYRASDDPTSYRFDNVAWLAKMPDGETRVIYTRANENGAEEIINWHKVSNDKYVERLRSFGTPAETRTRILSLERSGSSPLTYGDNQSLPRQNPPASDGGTPTGDRPFNVAASGQTLAETGRTAPTAPRSTPTQTVQGQSPRVPSSPSPRLSNQSEQAYTGSIAREVYEDNRARVQKGTGRVERMTLALRAAVRSLGKGSDKLLGPISTRLKNIDPSLKQAMRGFEYKLGTSIQKDRRAAEGFLKGMKTLDLGNYADLDLALKNGDQAVVDAIIKKHGLEEQYGAVRAVLDDLYERANEVGYDVDYRGNYFPRMIADSEGFLAYLGKADDWSIIEEAIKAKEVELGRYLLGEEKAKLVNSLLRGYGEKITLSDTGAMKDRTVDLVDGGLNQFYRDSADALLHYIDSTNEAIEAARFFGKGSLQNEFSSIDDSIGTYVLNLLAKGKIKPGQEKELRDILQARFGQMGTTGIVKVYKNLSYIDTMGSVSSAITQIGDLAFALYKGGPVETVKALGKSIVGKSQITRADLGIEKIAQEFEEHSKSAEAVSRVFRLIGLEKMDTLGKETLINAAIGKYRKLAENPTTDFIRRMEAVFGPDITPILDDLKSGKVTENVKLLAFNDLLDVQPAALSEMPEQYLRGGNGRIFYMLKTYTVKLFDVYRNEVFQQMRTDPVQATKNLIYLASALVVMNASADEIKDLLLNRETSLQDRTVDNIMKLMGFSKFTIYKAREEGIGSATARTILPPFKAIDSAYKDMVKGEFSETMQSIPIGGKLYYWWFGKGAEKTEKKRQESSGIEIPSIDILSIEVPSIDIPSISI